MKAMILAAGFGTRLRPITYTVPKAAVPVCNRPLIGWMIEAFLAHGVRDFVVNLHHLPDLVERCVVERYGGRASFAFAYEPQILGTGGALRNVQHLLASEEHFFLANADMIKRIPAERLVAARRSSGALAALTLRPYPNDDYFTPVLHDAGRVTGFGAGTGDRLMFAGSHLVSSRIFRWLPEEEFSGIIADTYRPVLARGDEVIAAVIDDQPPWFDVGTPWRYLGATSALLGGRSLVAETARVTGRVDRSCVGARSFVEGDLRDSVVWERAAIGAGVVLESCIVAHDVELRAPGTYRNAIICRDHSAIPRDCGAEFDAGLVFYSFDQPAVLAIRS